MEREKEMTETRLDQLFSRKIFLTTIPVGKIKNFPCFLYFMHLSLHASLDTFFPLF